MKKLLTLLLPLAAALMLVLAGCGGGSKDASPSGPTVQGYIYSTDGRTPIAGANVTLNTIVLQTTRVSTSRAEGGLQTTTDANGFFRFNNLTTGDKELTVTAGAFTFTRQVTVTDEAPVTVGSQSQPICLGTTEGSNTVHMAVVEGSYDRIQDVLTTLGLPQQTSYNAASTGWVFYGYGHEAELLGSSSEMAKYNIIFLNCGLDESFLDDTNTMVLLRAFVQNGGTLYASDQAYDYIERTWPQRIDFFGDDTISDDAQCGESGTITAQVHIQGIGFTTMPVDYDLSSWAMIEKAPETTISGQEVTVLIEGPRPVYDPNSYSVSLSKHSNGMHKLPLTKSTTNYPIMVQFTDGNGKVIYSSFHTEAQVNASMSSVLNRIALGGI